jgi:16S rRNA (uracil1498-N3)-methyltransferase
MGESLPRARLVLERCPDAGQVAALSREQAAHARARRLVPGDLVTLVDGTGAQARGRLLKLSGSGGQVAIEEVFAAAPEEIRIDLYVPGLKPERLSWIAEKATELGAGRLILVSAERTQSFRASPAGASRLARVARAAALQSERARWPEISGPEPLARVLSTADAGARLFLDFEGGLFPSRLSGPVSILVGPEGGWTAAERAAAAAAGWSPVTLPAGKLRAETAAIAAMVLARAAMARGAGEGRKA